MKASPQMTTWAGAAGIRPVRPVRRVVRRGVELCDAIRVFDVDNLVPTGVHSALIPSTGRRQARRPRNSDRRLVTLKDRIPARTSSLTISTSVSTSRTSASRA